MSDDAPGSARARHVWIRPAYNVGRPRQGLVQRWELRHTQTSSPTWWAFVWYVDNADALHGEWMPGQRLTPVDTLGR